MTSEIENYNADELVAPKWLDDEFFKDVLVQHLEDAHVQVISVNISPATARGDHFASIMFRAIVEYKSEKKESSISLIIKTMPEEEGFKKEFLGDGKFFPTEITMYTEVLPKMQAILNEVGDDTVLCAKCVYHTLSPRQVMVFEDLVTQNYNVIRGRPANLDEIKAALEKLAKWHAVSYKLLQENPDDFDKLKYDLTTVPNFLEQDFMKTSVPDFLAALSQNDKLKDYCQYFEPLKDILIKRWMEVIREYRENRQDDAYYVLCHGDFHLKNMMFKGNECMLLDFQISYVGSMTNDILYAIYMFLGPEERRYKYDELIYFYFTTFQKTLSKIGYKGEMPKLIEYRRQLFDRRYQELLLLTVFLPGFMSMRRGEDPSEKMLDPVKRGQMFSDEEYHEELAYLLPRILHKGYFENLN